MSEGVGVENECVRELCEIVCVESTCLREFQCLSVCESAF